MEYSVPSKTASHTIIYFSHLPLTPTTLLLLSFTFYKHESICENSITHQRAGGAVSLSRWNIIILWVEEVGIEIKNSYKKPMMYVCSVKGIYHTKNIHTYTYSFQTCHFVTTVIFGVARISVIPLPVICIL